MRDEFGLDYQKSQSQSELDLSWKLSLARSLAVYRFLLGQGVKPELIRLEAFGRFRPRYSNQSAQGRKRNRRVELVLDKRISSWEAEKIAQAKSNLKPKVKSNQFIYKDFIFKLNEPGAK